MKISFEPRDLWVGFWLDTRRYRLFCCPLPCVAISWTLADPAAVARYDSARRALNANYLADVEAGRLEETDEFLRLNRAVADAECFVPRWLVWMTDQRILRETNFWARLGEAAETELARQAFAARGSR